jgi:hypothetical protein
MIWLLSSTAALSILISALCSASETATFAIGTSRLRTLEEEGFQGAEALAELRNRAPQTRASLLFLYTLFGAVAVGTVVLLGYALYGAAGGRWGLLAGSLAALIVGSAGSRSEPRGPTGRARRSATSVNSLSWGRRRGWSVKTSTCWWSAPSAWTN